ncbi:MAG: hypothetical protein H0U92_02865 [Actinobacteria bacterium]|nr:hypothetical protein [Actinomycetota bacterium]
MTDPDDEALEHGTRVEVRQRFDGRWARGFTIEHARDDGYVVRRDLDGSVLPEQFSAADIRHERRKRNMWWA